MALDKIEKLLEKYFDATTTIAEEKVLKNYFASNNVTRHLEQYKSLFGYVVKAKQEQFEATVELKGTKRKRYFWMSIAATVTVIFGVGLFVINQENQSKAQNLGVVDDPEVAFKETQKALALISQSVNIGIGSMYYINEFENSKNKIFKK